jgi:hypothetical protein
MTQHSPSTVHATSCYTSQNAVIFDHYWKIRDRKQRTDIGKYSFVNRRAITDWNKLPEGAIGTSHGKTHIFKTRVRKVKTSEGK